MTDSGRVIRGTVLHYRDDPAAAGPAEAVRWHLRGRLRYAITVRFAITSSNRQLQLAGELAAARPELPVQSHLGESHGRRSLSFFPGSRPPSRQQNLKQCNVFGGLPDRPIISRSKPET